MSFGSLLRDARERTLALVAGLGETQRLGPKLDIVNPPVWEVGHVGWFQEFWILRHVLGRQALRADADALWNSSTVAHATRWSLPHPRWEEVLAYDDAVLAQVAEAIAEDERAAPAPPRIPPYFAWLALLHEDMHAEAFLYTLQTHGWCGPRNGPEAEDVREQMHAGAGPWPGEVEVPGGRFRLGTTTAEPFVFDNETDAHPVVVAPFRMARAPVTQAEFAEFVDAGGYRDERWWSRDGRAWLAASGAAHPLHWTRGTGGGWLRRGFDQWLALEPHRPVVHVNAFEAEAYARCHGRRLPTEAEWECAAACGAGGRTPDGLLAKRRFPWGDEPPSPRRANLDCAAGDTIDVAGCPDGDSPAGCRQLIGNVWEWTATAFEPYPNFRAGPYADYSAPWFGNHRVLRGGCFATRSRLIRNSWRNFYTPDRRDVWAGFRLARDL